MNRLLHDIGSTKQLWLSIVRDLSARRQIDAPRDFDNLSKDMLVEEVRRAVDGPRTWSPKCSVLPTLRRRVIIAVDRFRCPELLPGGSHVLCYFENNGDDAVEVVETHSGRQIWTWSQRGRSVYSAVFDFRVGTTAALVALTLTAP